MSAYRINEIAKLFNISPDTIRLYEQKKLITPKREKENNYRGYTATDIARIFDIKTFQNMGFTLTEIELILKAGSADETLQKIEEKAKEAQEQLDYYNRIIVSMKRFNDYLELEKKKSYLHCLEFSPHMIVGIYCENGKISNIDHPFFQAAVKYKTLFSRCLLVPEKDYTSQSDNIFLWAGYSVTKENADYLGIIPDETVCELVPRVCVTTVIRVGDGLTSSSLNETFQWMKDHNFKAAGRLLAVMLRFDYDKGQLTRLYKIYIPVE